MTTSASTVAWIGAGGVILGAVVGALASWITAVVTSQRAAREARDDRRRAAYSAFISALDEILSLYLKPGDWGQQIAANPAFVEGIRQTLSSIGHASVAVLLAASPEARNAVEGIDRARWGVIAALANPANAAQVPPLMDQFITAKTKITDIGRGELTGPRSWWRICYTH